MKSDGIIVKSHDGGHVILTDVTVVNSNLKYGVFLQGYSKGYLTNVSFTNVIVNDNSIEREILGNICTRLWIFKIK